MNRLPKEIAHVILDLWLPRHWFAIYRTELEKLKQIGYFKKDVYIRRKSSKTINWFVDHTDMEADSMNKGEFEYKRGLFNKEMSHPNANIGWIRCIGSRNGPFSKMTDPWLISPDNYPATVKLHPRKRKVDDQVELRFRGIYHKTTSCTWVGLSRTGVVTTLGSADRYMIASINALHTLDIEPSAITGHWEFRKNKGGTLHVPLDLLTFLHNK